MYSNDIDVCIGRFMDREESFLFLGLLADVRYLLLRTEQVLLYLYGCGGGGGGGRFQSFQEFHDRTLYYINPKQ